MTRVSEILAFNSPPTSCNDLQASLSERSAPECDQQPSIKLYDLSESGESTAGLGGKKGVRGKASVLLVMTRVQGTDGKF